jgi:PAS domain S-box-containing protein
MIEMDYTNFSRDQLIMELSELRNENASLKQQILNSTSGGTAKDTLSVDQPLLRTLVDLLPAYVYVKDSESRFLMANESCAQYMGALSSHDLIGKTDADFYPAHLAEGFRAEELEVLKGIPLINKEESGVLNGTGEIILLTTKVPLKDNNGNIIGLVGTSFDITEMKKISEARIASESNLQALINNTNESIWSLDKDFNLIICNDNFRNSYLAAYNVDLMLGINLLEILSPAMRELWKPKYDIALSGQRISFEFHETIQNTLYYFNVYLNPIYTSGKVTGVSALSVNINERKSAELALKESEEWFRSLFEQSGDGIFYLTPDGKIMAVNKSFAEMHGYSQDEILKMNIRSLDCADSQVVYDERFERMRRGEKLKFEVEHFHKDGHRIPLEVTTGLITMGNKSYVMASHREITERKLAENAIIKAREKAEQSDRLKSAFLANMGHEIRTPMNGILGFSELLKNKTLSGEEQQEYVSIIEKSGARMLNIINDLIDLSKIESGLMSVHKSRYNINEQTDYIYSFFKPETESRGLLFYSLNGLPHNEAFIETDKEKVNAVLINLIKNSIKFTDRGSIKFGYTEKPGNLEFFVRDTGVGISPEQKEIIFERFRQGSESLSRNYEGAGLGLSISKSFVEMLGGTIWMESKLGEGSAFYFTVPYDSGVAEKKLVDESKAETRGKKHNLNVLIAEDDEFSSLLISSIVKNISSEILFARTGREAVDICRSHPGLDLILMDIKMPDTDGYNATKQIRRFNEKVVIIAQTSYAQTGDREKALEAGCNDYISKPILKNDLLSMIKRHFED